MKKYLIFTDASGDYDAADALQNDLKFVPMQYSLGEDMRVCCGLENPEILKKFYDGQRTGDLTKTSQITPFMYEEYFSGYMEKGYSILYLALSGGLSSTYSAACVAKEALKEKYPEVDLYPVDTKSATGGIGVLLQRVFDNQAKGMDIEENYQDILQEIPHIRHWFMVQDLMYLKRGGRVSATTAMVGTVLGIKPILKINEEGKLDTIAKKRGNKSAVAYLVELFKNSFDISRGNMIYVCHADALDLAEDLKAQILKLYPQAVVKTTMLSPIIGAHTGPGMAAICHFGK